MVVGWAGGLVVGTLLFGNAGLALRRIYGKYEYYIKDDVDDVRGSENVFTIKFNN